MKNTIRRGLCLLLLLAMTAAMAACGPKNTNTDADEKTMVYAVEAGSAGEEVAKEKGWTVNSVQDQAAALMEVAAGTSDAAVIDLLMAGAMIGPDTSYSNLTYTDSLTQEEYEALPPQDRERVLARAKETFLAAGADGVLLNLSQLPQWLEEQEKED